MTASDLLTRQDKRTVQIASNVGVARVDTLVDHRSDAFEMEGRVDILDLRRPTQQVGFYDKVDAW